MVMEAATTSQAMGALCDRLTRTTFEYSGNAVGLYPSWTHSWRLRHISVSGRVVDEHVREGFSGVTSVSTGTYYASALGGGDFEDLCAEMRIYHSRTVGQNLLDVDQDCG